MSLLQPRRGLAALEGLLHTAASLPMHSALPPVIAVAPFVWGNFIARFRGQQIPQLFAEQGAAAAAAAGASAGAFAARTAADARGGGAAGTAHISAPTPAQPPPAERVRRGRPAHCPPKQLQVAGKASKEEGKGQEGKAKEEGEGQVGERKEERGRPGREKQRGRERPGRPECVVCPVPRRVWSHLWE
eukprot:151095-Chlamydomonas_euryale.AAC.1